MALTLRNGFHRKSLLNCDVFNAHRTALIAPHPLSVLAMLALFFLSLGVEASAQSDCGKVCTWEFWDSATPEEIEAALSVVAVTARDAEGRTALHLAARNGTYENISILLDAGADVHARTEFGWTPLHYAASATQENIVALLKAGAAANARGDFGGTPLHIAAAEGTPESLLSLLEAGSEVNARSEWGVTPLHVAAAEGTPELVMALLNAGADATLRRTDGKTPFDIAKENEDLVGTGAYWELNDARFK